jgi:hypothetical protein
VIRIPVDPFSRVHPRQHLLQESINISLTRVNTKLSNPNRLLERVVELGEVVLKIGDVGRCVVVRDDKVDLAVAAASHELLEVVNALVLFGAVGHGGRADFETRVGQGLLDVLLVCRDGLVDGHVGASAAVVVLDKLEWKIYGGKDIPILIWLVEAQDVLDVVL